MRMIVLLLLVGVMTLTALIIKAFGFISWPWWVLFIPLLVMYLILSMWLIIYCLIEYTNARKRFPYRWI